MIVRHHIKQVHTVRQTVEVIHREVARLSIPQTSPNQQTNSNDKTHEEKLRSLKFVPVFSVANSCGICTYKTGKNALNTCRKASEIERLDNLLNNTCVFRQFSGIETPVSYKRLLREKLESTFLVVKET